MGGSYCNIPKAIFYLLKKGHKASMASAFAQPCNGRHMLYDQVSLK